MENESIEKVADQLITSFGDLDEGRVIQCAKRLLAEGASRILMLHLLKEGMKRVGELYEKGEYFIADLIVSGEIYRNVLELPPMRYIPQEGESLDGKVLIGTAEGDVHDIGKDMLKSVLSANGFEVIDLGTDVSPRAFVSASIQFEPDIVAISGILTISVSAMERTIKALSETNLRDKVKVIVGGLCMTYELSQQIGADAYSPDPFSGLLACKTLLRRSRKGELDGRTGLLQNSK